MVYNVIYRTVEEGPGRVWGRVSGYEDLRRAYLKAMSNDKPNSCMSRILGVSITKCLAVVTCPDCCINLAVCGVGHPILTHSQLHRGLDTSWFDDSPYALCQATVNKPSPSNQRIVRSSFPIALSLTSHLAISDLAEYTTVATLLKFPHDRTESPLAIAAQWTRPTLTVSPSRSDVLAHCRSHAW